jgi:alpha-tubulin suppressor-like RCC1 family protein
MQASGPATNAGVFCWGTAYNGNAATTSSEALQITGTNTAHYFTQLAAGTDFTCALRNDGAVLCWGLGTSGQIGNGSSTTQANATQVSGLTSGVVAITAGAAHACALKNTGEVVCWGANGSGQLGDNSQTNRNTPVVVSSTSGGSTIVSVAAGTSHTCAARVDGTASCWGNNATSNGVLGINSSIATTYAVPQSVQWSSGVTSNSTLRPQMCNKHTIP